MPATKPICRQHNPPAPSSPAKTQHVTGIIASNPNSGDKASLTQTLEFTIQVHLFRANGRVFGVTQDATGANLPTDYGAWNAFKTLDMTPGNPMPGIDVDECLSDIEAHGFHLTDAHVRITDRHV